MAIERHRVVWPWRPHLVLLLSAILIPAFLYLFPHSSSRTAHLAGSEVAKGGVFLGLLLLAGVGAGLGWFPKSLGGHEVEVGHDGIRLSKIHRRRFLSYTQIERVETRNTAVVLHLHGGEEIALHLWTGSGDDVDARRALVESIERGRAAHAQERSAVEAETDLRLERRGRDLRAWVAEARDLGRGGSGYRNAEIDRDVLWRVVESGNTPEESRVAAALALGAMPDPTERQRLAAVAAECVSPRVRVALEELDDETLVEQLELAAEKAK